MSGRTTLLLLTGLLALLGVETALAFTKVPRLLLPGIGLAMVAVTGLGFMRLRASGTLATVFAMAGLFWLCIMMTLGSMDSATRSDMAVRRLDVRPISGGMPPN